MTPHAFASEDVLRKFLQSDAINTLRAAYDKHFDDVSERTAQVWAQAFP